MKVTHWFTLDAETELSKRINRIDWKFGIRVLQRINEHESDSEDGFSSDLDTSPGYTDSLPSYIDSSPSSSGNFKRSAKNIGNTSQKKGGDSDRKEESFVSARLQPRANERVVSSRSIPFDIQYISMPPRADGRLTHGLPQNIAYSYDSSEGKGVDVFVVDSGFAPLAEHHAEFKDSVGQIKGWFRAKGPWPAKPGTDVLEAEELRNQWHGTNVISRLIGKHSGLASKANIWPAVTYDAYGNFQHIYAIDILLQIRDKILVEAKKDPEYKAIVNLSWAFDDHKSTSELTDERTAKVYLKELYTSELEYIRSISEIADNALELLLALKNVIVVTGAGNGNVGTPITDWPAKRGKDFKNLVVVGSVEATGNILAMVPADFVMVYTLASSLFVPVISSDQETIEANEYTLISGISFGTPTVSAILANHLSSNPKWGPIQAIEKLYKDAYPRRKEGVPIVWTGIGLAVDGDVGGKPSSGDEGASCRAKGKAVDRGPQNPETEFGDDTDCEYEIDSQYGGEDPDNHRPEGAFISTRTVLEVHKTQTVLRTVDVTATTLVTRLTNS
ncbi:hypothetical protein H072_128 [Dactylellina haptotyla CBS 200.50]|uniref:Peptidase S8/S53 domain-containing protein n=1 Tax=Dactylellina haptotyla (strain CBS 200.50) TaxID=1284197 RepID=S8C2H2_DACHA|nr:hypothetical protein H072_128 [Dactylellina haptotyla CBS 200.50]